ncbi:MAG: HAMP domain-containing protein [Mongoliibacter sp.]|uniref:sensor histidine kinase n=1 Tax=Mongoliibacter sp. TaxID=2022438 RepID=UPI0012F38E9A|nr:HAMP domain-containing sensor histidine kinase [Mongoliibacter sp.]TVP49962.1 MAG: HAMP domain-containing protein [Mongoliibacter sp.]
MSIQQRISLLFTALAAGILLVFMLIVYFSANQNRKSEFYNILQKEALTKVNLLLNVKLDANTLQTIYRKNREVLYEVEVAIYNQNKELLYHDAVDIDFVKETPEMLAEIREQKMIRFVQDQWQVIGQLIEVDNEPYYVTAAAFDAYGYRNLENLRNTMLVSFFFGLAIIYLIGRYFSQKTMDPITDMVNEAQKISASNLDLRLHIPKRNDELGVLAETFNQMLERLEKSFDAQKQFVSHISHELRTPLSVIIAELELSQNKKRSKEEYKETVISVLADAKKLAKLSSTLLDFAKASYDRSEVNFKQFRVDELLLDASQELQLLNQSFKVDLDFEGDFEEEEITVFGNSYLLTIAFKNLIENACKYSSNHTCRCSISTSGNQVQVAFKDEGIGIYPEELEEIFNPFFRGKNKNIFEGTGIGLALVKRIVNLHDAEVTVQSKPGKGSTFIISIPRI